MIFMHHPPFEVSVPELNRINCLGGQEMGAIVARHPNVERVLCGHFHRPVERRWCGTIGSVAPSTAYQNAFDLRPARLRFRLEPPGLLLHVWRPGTGLVSHTLAIGDFGRAYDHGRLADSGRALPAA